MLLDKLCQNAMGAIIDESEELAEADEESDSETPSCSSSSSESGHSDLENPLALAADNDSQCMPAHQKKVRTQSFNSD